MTYDLVIGDYAYSSWSLRGWLMFDAFGIPVTVHRAGVYTGTLARDLADFAPARLVPVLRTPEGTIVQETLAIAETLAERHPKAGLWPTDPAQRASARWLVAEMHAGFLALRSECPMNLATIWETYVPSPAVLRDLERIASLWRHAFGMSGGPWLFGEYSLADVFYAPVAARIAGYNLPADDEVRACVQRHLQHPSFRRWHDMARANPVSHTPRAMDEPGRPWEG